MRIQLKQSWKIWGVGHVIPDMPDGQASMLIGRGVAAEVREVRAPVRQVLRAKNYVTKGA